MAADLREEQPADAHPKRRRDVLDERLHVAGKARVGVEAEEADELVLVERRPRGTRPAARARRVRT